MSEYESEIQYEDGEVTIVGDKLSIAEEEFAIDPEAGMIYLVHPYWMIVGMGESLEEAEKDVRISASMWLHESQETEIKLPQKMIDFCLDVYTDPFDENGNCRCSTCRYSNQ